MGSGTFIFLGLLLGVALLFSSEVADARDLAETTPTHNYKKDTTYEKASSTDVEDARHGGKEGHPDQMCYTPDGCCHGCCVQGYQGCSQCCPSPSSAKAQPHN